MRPRTCTRLLILALVQQWSFAVAKNFSTLPWGQPSSLVSRQASVFDDRPADCPPCFNCNLDDFKCQQFGECAASSGRCRCPEGFGGEDCGVPLCGSPADGHDRIPRPTDQKYCDCAEGWEGINCNVCTQDQACNALMPEEKDGVCYRNGIVQKQNHQFCEVTNQKILDMLDPRRPQVTFSCSVESSTCDFQFWVEHQESFYCALDSCTWDFQAETDRNVTVYQCEHLKCRCIPGRPLCGEEALDLTDFIGNQITGPALFKSVSYYNDKSKDKTSFEESHLDGLINQVFGDTSIFLNCGGGECLYKTQVPGYVKPVVPINTSLVAGVIAGSAMAVVAVGLTVAWLSRKKRSAGHYGLLRLDDEDEAHSALMSNHRPAALHFQDVSYNIGGRQILSNIQGSVHPGELLAIMGASGAGKTTMLDILARKNKRGSTRGSFYVNGESMSDEDFRAVIGFVDQDDAMLSTLTVHETILDSALLRLPKDMSLAAKEQRVEEVERQLGIHHLRNSLIGSSEGHRGISGGEKRRVGIACELVTSPSILFLDEPTSGLDAFNAYNVIECLVKLAKTHHRTIIFTIHQPRSNIVALFDRLLLLAAGRIVYSGPFKQCQQYFNDLGYTCPAGFNIADYIVDLTMNVQNEGSLEDESLMSPSPSSRPNGGLKNRVIKTKFHDDSSPSLEHRSSAEEALLGETDSSKRTERVDLSARKEETAEGEAWHEMSDRATSVANPLMHESNTSKLETILNIYEVSTMAALLQEQLQQAVANANEHKSSANSDSPQPPSQHRIGLGRQFMILASRMWRNLYRNPMLMLTHYITSTILAVLLGYLFFGLTDDIAGFQNRMGILSFVLALFGFSTLTTLTIFADERLLFMRERAKGYYHPSAYFAAKVFFDIVPLRLIPPIILSIIVYPMTGLVPAWPQFLIFTSTLVLFNFAAAAVCLFIGIVIRNGGTANLVGSLVMLFSLLFSGLFLNHEKIPLGARWLQMLSIFHYAFEALLVNEVHYLSLTEHKWGLDIEVPGASILSSFGFRIQALWSDVIGLAVFASTFVLLAYLAMHFLLVEKR